VSTWNAIKRLGFNYEMKEFRINASEVAALIGKNKFKSASEAWLDFWKRNSPETFTGKTVNDVAQDALNAAPKAIRDIFYDAYGKKAANSSEAQANFTQAAQQIAARTDISEEDKAKVTQYMKSKVYTTHGTRTEDRTALLNPNWKKDPRTHKLSIYETPEANFVIVGKIDRIDETEETLIEIKNRARGLFKRVAEYENVQVQVYLQMLDLQKAKLVEQYNEEVGIDLIFRDDDLWELEILPKLVQVCMRFHAEVVSAGQGPASA